MTRWYCALSSGALTWTRRGYGNYAPTPPPPPPPSGAVIGTTLIIPFTVSGG